MGIDNSNSFNDEELEAIQKKYFTNSFRLGYVTVDGVTMPKRFEEMRGDIFNWEVNEQDVWICSFPKTGTTWTQEMVWMIMNDLDFEAGQVNLGHRSPFFEVSALFDYRELMANNPEFVPPPFLQDSLKFVKSQKSPICMKSHLPLNLLPKQLQDGTKKPKIIYVCRNPKDTCISLYHHVKLLEGYTGNFENFCKLFLAGKVSFAPYWNHVLRFWEKRNEPNVYFLRYEDMKSDLPSIIRQIASFLEKELSDEQVDILTKHLSFESMKLNPAVNYELVRELNKKFKLIEYEGEFMRSGKVGEYKSIMSPEVNKKFDEWTKENLNDSSFSFAV